MGGFIRRGRRTWVGSSSAQQAQVCPEPACPREKGEQQTTGRDRVLYMREKGETKRFNNASATLQRVLC